VVITLLDILIHGTPLDAAFHALLPLYMEFRNARV